MNTKSFLSSAAILSSLLASTSLCTPAWAQKAPPLAPITGWAVTHIDANADSGAYCALARRFSRNTILTLARNGNNETSIALDLQTSVLSPGINIQVVLDPGAGEQRTYDIAPASDKAFVVRLGRDDRFFAALQTTGLLRIDAGGETYNFNLADIDDGQSKLNSCIDNQNSGEVAEQGAENTAPTGGSDVHQQLASLRSDVQGLRQENKRLTDIVGKSDNLQSLKQPDAHDSVIKSELSSSAERLKTENQDLKDQASGVSSGDDLAVAVPLKHLQNENSRLQNTLFSMSLKHADVNGVSDTISDSMKKGVSTQSVSAVEPAAGDDPQNNVYALRAENARLQKAIAQKSIAQSGYQQVADNAPAPTPVSPVMQPPSPPQNAVQITEPAVPNAPPAMQPAPVHPVAAAPTTPPPAVASAPVTPPPAHPIAPPAPPVNPTADMQKKIDSLNATIADKDKQLVELSALKTEAETLRAKNKELEDKLVKNSGDKKSIDALNQKIKNLQAENAKLTGQIKQSTVGSGDVDKIAALTKENEDLKSQIETLKQVQKTGSLGAQDAAELISLRKENADLKQQLADLETQLKAASNGKPVSNAKMQHDMQAMAHENMELKERLAKYEHASPASEATVDQTSDAIPAKKSGSVKAAKAPVKTPKHKTDDVVAVAPKSVASPKDDEDNLDVPSDVSDAAVKDDVRSVVEDDAESEAQREEAKMRDSLKTPPPAPAVAPKAAAKSASDDKPVEVHASQDPFAPIKADNDVKSYESVAGAHPKAVAKSSAPGREDATEAVPTPVESESIPPLDNEKVDAPKVAAPPVAKSVDKTDDAGSEKINWNKPPATSAAVAKPVTSSSVKMPDKGVYQPEFSVKDVLNKAQLVSEDNVKLVPKASNANKAAWQWKTGDVYGSAEQTAMPDAEKFDGDVKEYLDKTQKRCSGDFAIEPDNSKQLGDMRLDSYEIACVGKGVNSSASLLFIGKDGTFTAMAHEAPADKMSDAMNIRDKLMKLISGS